MLPCPPVTEEYFPLAVLSLPPVIEENSPSASFATPTRRV
jgi:hypothetical protein